MLVQYHIIVVNAEVQSLHRTYDSDAVGEGASRRLRQALRPIPLLAGIDLIITVSAPLRMTSSSIRCFVVACRQHSQLLNVSCASELFC